MDDISSIRVFLEVVDAGSFSAAARRLGVTPSAVSRHVSQLEANLGARLFSRTTRKQSLTEAGELYLAHTRHIALDIEAARQAVAGLSEVPSGTLHVAAEPDFASTLIAPLVPAFLERYPHVGLRIAMSANLVDLVDGKFDVAIRVGHLEDSSLIARRIAVSPSRLYASPAYLARHGAPAHPADLAGHACLSFRVGASRVRWRFRTDEGLLDVELRGPVKVDSISFLLKMALAHQGIVMIPAFMVGDSVECGALVAVLPDFPVVPQDTPVSAVYPHNRHQAPKVRAFVDHVAAHLRMS